MDRNLSDLLLYLQHRSNRLIHYQSISLTIQNSLFMKNWMWKAVTETDDKGKEHTIHIGVW